MSFLSRLSRFAHVNVNSSFSSSSSSSLSLLLQNQNLRNIQTVKLWQIFNSSTSSVSYTTTSYRSFHSTSTVFRQRQPTATGLRLRQWGQQDLTLNRHLSSKTEPDISPNPNTNPSESEDNTNTGVKKRPKRRTTGNRFLADSQAQGTSYDYKNSFPILAYATCEEMDLERLHRGLIDQDLYIPTVLSEDMEDVIHVSAKYKISDESREIFFFREGAVIFWNMPELECLNVLKFLKTFEHESYDNDQVTQELEYMRYYYHEQGASRLSKGRIVLYTESANKLLEKYAFANALASSVKLGIWESTLDKFVDSIAHITEELKRAESLNLSREQVLQKTGELFSLRHELNLNSDLLDTPDFYWERERLETLYQKTCNYLNIGRRTKVLNEKLAQCCELLELISDHLTDRHHTRLEWMIIALITIEVGFEILHVVERYLF